MTKEYPLSTELAEAFDTLKGTVCVLDFLSPTAALELLYLFNEVCHSHKEVVHEKLLKGLKFNKKLGNGSDKELLERIVVGVERLG